MMQRFLHGGIHHAQRHIVFARDAGTIVVFGRRAKQLTLPPLFFRLYRSPSGFHRAESALARPALDRLASQA
jgi:hypothetical protein